MIALFHGASSHYKKKESIPDFPKVGPEPSGIDFLVPIDLRNFTINVERRRIVPIKNNASGKIKSRILGNCRKQQFSYATGNIKVLTDESNVLQIDGQNAFYTFCYLIVKYFLMSG